MDRLPAREVDEWFFAYTTNPWGDEPLQKMLAELTALLANVYRDPKKKSTVWEPKDFLPFKRAPLDPRAVDRLTPEATADLLEQLFSAGPGVVHAPSETVG